MHLSPFTNMTLVMMTMTRSIAMAMVIMVIMITVVTVLAVVLILVTHHFIVIASSSPTLKLHANVKANLSFVGMQRMTPFNKN